MAIRLCDRISECSYFVDVSYGLWTMYCLYSSISSLLKECYSRNEAMIIYQILSSFAYHPISFVRQQPCPNTLSLYFIFVLQRILPPLCYHLQYIVDSVIATDNELLFLVLLPVPKLYTPYTKNCHK